jgi:hypothetical protein
VSAFASQHTVTLSAGETVFDHSQINVKSMQLLSDTVVLCKTSKEIPSNICGMAIKLPDSESAAKQGMSMGYLIVCGCL